MNIVIVDNDAFAVMSMKRILESDSEIMVSATGDSKENAVEVSAGYFASGVPNEWCRQC